MYNKLIKHLIKTKFQKQMLTSVFFEKILIFKHFLIISSIFDGFLTVTTTVSFLAWMEVKTLSIYFLFSIIKKSNWKHILLKSALILRYYFLTFLYICSIFLTILNLFFNTIKMPFAVFFNLTLLFLISFMEKQLNSHFSTQM